MRDKILVRKTKTHSKYSEWLDNKLAIFFINFNLKGNKLSYLVSLFLGNYSIYIF
jgi:hypothetical protein